MTSLGFLFSDMLFLLFQPTQFSKFSERSVSQNKKWKDSLYIYILYYTWHGCHFPLICQANGRAQLLRDVFRVLNRSDTGRPGLMQNHPFCAGFFRRIREWVKSDFRYLRGSWKRPGDDHFCLVFDIWLVVLLASGPKSLCSGKPDVWFVLEPCGQASFDSLEATFQHMRCGPLLIAPVA